MDTLDRLKTVLRERDIPFFSDEDLTFYLEKNGNDFDATAYECLIVKSEDSTVQISGLTTADTSNYFRRLASRYRPYNSGILQ